MKQLEKIINWFKSIKTRDEKGKLKSWVLGSLGGMGFWFIMLFFVGPAHEGFKEPALYLVSLLFDRFGYVLPMFVYFLLHLSLYILIGATLGYLYEKFYRNREVSRASK